MHYSQSEKYEIIQLVEQSDLGVNRTLEELKINKTTFYNWYNSYAQQGFEGLKRKKSGLHTKKTKRKTAQEELSPKAIRRIAEFYAPDIEVMEKAGFPFTVDF